jgi:hypothetical protein
VFTRDKYVGKKLQTNGVAEKVLDVFQLSKGI